MLKISCRSSLTINFLTPNVSIEQQKNIAYQFYNIYSKNTQEDGNTSVSENAPFLLESVFITPLDGEHYRDKLIEKQFLLFSFIHEVKKQFDIDISFSGILPSKVIIDGQDWLLDGKTISIDSIDSINEIHVIDSEFFVYDVKCNFVDQVKAHVLAS